MLDTAAAVARARGLAADEQRRFIGITGPPGAGKTTLAETIIGELGRSAATVPMDGFHLADVTLDRLGRREHKGAPDTFDVWGYLTLLKRLRRDREHVIYAPGFERTLEQPIAASIEIEPATSLLVTEGNYLLLNSEPWSLCVSALDEIWWVDSDPAERRRRLVARHVEFGKTPAAAEVWMSRVDAPNTRLVEDGRERADFVVR